MTDDRYISPHSLPTPHERELLTILIEECAEVQKCATKLLRFGADDTEPGKNSSNSERLALEIGDLNHMVDLIVKARVIRSGWITEGTFRKIEKLKKFMQTTPETTP